MGRITRSEEIRRKQESLAIKLQERALAEGATLTDQLDVFDRVTKWAAVSNKLEDQGDTRIDEFKRRITGEASENRDYPPSRRPKGWTAPPAKQPRLDALKQRLPAGSNGSPVGDSDGAEREDSAASG